MATTHDTHEDAWAWPCPYCGTSNALESAVCVGCRAQLRDPEEDDLFTTVATDNAQMVDPDAPRIREVLWSTEAPPEDLVVEEVHEPDPFAGGAQPGTMPPGTPVAPQAAGPFSPESPGRAGADNPGAFGPAGSQRSSATPGGEPPTSATPFGPRPAGTERHASVDGQGGGLAGQAPASQPEPPAGAAGPAPTVSEAPPHEHVTPDENGLSVAVSQLGPREQERCAVPIGVCGALLGDQELVIGVLAGQLMGHPSVLVVTSSRVLMANSRRWKPVLDQFIPAADLGVHLRHDRDIASLTIVQGPRLTTLDGISDVAGAVELSDRIRRLAEGAGPG